MASAAKRKRPEEWEEHRDTIQDLFHQKRLPLFKEVEPCVVNVMREKYNFSATPAQYESQLKKWNQPKNLSKDVWKAVLHKVDELSSNGIDARVIISGQVVEKPRIKRARRYTGVNYHNSDNPLPQDNDAAASSCCQYIQVLHNGEWHAYDEAGRYGSPSASATANSSAVYVSAVDAPSADASKQIQASSDNLATSLFDSPRVPSADHDSQPSDACVIVSQANTPVRSIIDTGLDETLMSGILSTCWSPLSISWMVEDINLQPPTMSPIRGLSSPHINPYDLTNSSHLLYESQLTNHQTLPVQASTTNTLQLTGSPNRSNSIDFDSFIEIHSPSPAPLFPQTLSTSFLDKIRFLLESNKIWNDQDPLTQNRGAPSFESISMSFRSLLPDNAEKAFGTRKSMKVANVLEPSAFDNRLMYSIMNNFAGLGDIHLGAILQVFRQQQGSSQIFARTRDWPREAQHALAENLLRAALYGGDSDVAKKALAAARDTGYSLDPNSFSCEWNGDRYTPLEFAAMRRYTDLAHFLLEAGADVNKTLSSPNYPLERPHGALEAILWELDPHHEHIVVDLTQTLLDRGVDIKVRHVLLAVEAGGHLIAQKLLDRYLPDHHRICFEHLVKTISMLEDEVATKYMRLLFNICRVRNCHCCFKKHDLNVRSVLQHSLDARKLKLARLLVTSTALSPLSLAVAVRLGDRDLIHHLLSLGAEIDGPADQYLQRIEGTTPLAEAIRSQNYDVIRQFEDAGALSRLSEGRRFEAAMNAAVNVGDLGYIRKLLSLSTGYNGHALDTALEDAIRNDKTEVAFVLLDAGVNATHSLSTAISMRNRAVVDRVLECDVCPTSEAMRKAIDMGDLDLVRRLIPLRPDLEGMLANAVRARNRDMVKLFVQNGAQAHDFFNTKWQRIMLPLEEAIRNDDNAMLELLLSLGADPLLILNPFPSHEVSPNGAAFEMIIAAFHKKYPLGYKGYGGRFLKEAIRGNNISLVELSLQAKLDINTPCRDSSDERGFEISPLGFAIKSFARLDIVQRLLDAGGDLHSFATQKPERQTALMVAIESGNIGAAKLIVTRDGEINHPARDGWKRTLLQKACEVGNYSAVELLLVRGAQVNAPAAERGGGTALQFAAISGSLKIVLALLENNADIHAQPSKVNGRTALQGAAEHGRLHILMTLWEAASGQGFSTKEIDLAIKYASSNDHKTCARYLIDLQSKQGLLDR